MEEFKLVLTEKNDFEDLDANIDNILGIFGRFRIGSTE